MSCDHKHTSAPPPELVIYPPLLNSASPWASTLKDLRSLFECPSTGAVTTRTALLSPDGFPHHPLLHQFAFFDPASQKSESGTGTGYHEGRDTADVVKENSLARPTETSSLNNLGYSPLPLASYLEFIVHIAKSLVSTVNGASRPDGKTFIISVAGTPVEVAECYRRVSRTQDELYGLSSSLSGTKIDLALEINLSCPNIQGKSPPAYDMAELERYMEAMGNARPSDAEIQPFTRIPWGVKTPPYTDPDQFRRFHSELVKSRRFGEGKAPLSFVTATNTLGSCLLLSTPSSSSTSSSLSPVYGHKLPGDGIGGMGGAGLHPLALGNVSTLKKWLAGHEATKHVTVIGVGGVQDVDGYRRMREVGADFVGVATGLGRKGVSVFEEIENDLKDVKW